MQLSDYRTAKRTYLAKHTVPSFAAKCWRSAFLCTCLHCRMPFPRFGQLVSHLVRHSAGVSPHECRECHRTFHSPVVYGRHRRLFHAKKVPLVPQKCDPRLVFCRMPELHFQPKGKHDNLPTFGSVVQTPQQKVARIQSFAQGRKSCAQKTAKHGRTSCHSKAAYKSVKEGKPQVNNPSPETVPVVHQLKECSQTLDDFRPYYCLECDRWYKRHTGLIEHVMTTHEQHLPRHDQTSVQQSSVAAHQVWRSSNQISERPPVPEGRLASLSTPNQTDSATRRHRCKFCQELFTRSCDLTSHTLQHMRLNSPRMKVAVDNSDLKTPRTTNGAVAKSRKFSKPLQKVVIVVKNKR